jgi:hypothetical protein
VRLLHRNPTFCPDHVGLRDATANPTYGYLLNNGIANYAIIKQIACNTQGEVKSIVPASPTSQVIGCSGAAHRPLCSA